MQFSFRAIFLLAASLCLLGAKSQTSPQPSPAPAPQAQRPSSAPASAPPKFDDRYPLPNEKMPGDCLREGKAYNRKKRACAVPNKAFCNSHQMGFNGTECVRVAPKQQKKAK